MNDRESSEMLHPMGVVTRRTGLKADLVRAWERRYGAIAPERSVTARRLYSDDDIRRLRLLRDVTRRGHPISQVAVLSNAELEGLLSPATSIVEPRGPSAATRLDRALAAVRSLDAPALTRGLEGAALDLGRLALVEKLLLPLMTRIGELWREGSLGPAHEHLATAAVRTLLSNALADGAGTEGPVLLATTPQGQRHELGILLAAAVAAGEGWRVVYLGADLPAAAIADAAAMCGATAVALGVALAESAPPPVEELRRLAEELAGVPILLGGRAAAKVGTEVAGSGVSTVTDLASFRSALAALAARPA